MEKMYQKYKDIAEFRLVYIREAHALGSRRESTQAKEHSITDAKTFGERCSLAASFIDNEKLTVPTIVDDIENTVSEAYGAFLIDYLLLELMERLHMQQNVDQGV